jgi:hydroxymethylglutaryl-CoA synthase
LAGIVSYGSYIPRYRITVEEIAKAQGQSPSQIKESLHLTEKSVPGIDEDTATIAVEAAKNALSAANLDPKQIGAIFIGSESHPYAVKPTGAILGEAIGVGNDYTTADLEFACKAGTAGIQIALGLVRSKMCGLALAGGCDTAQSMPGDALEFSAAAGGAVFIIGDKNVVAEIHETVSFTSDTPDFWRREHQRYPSHGGAFTGEPAYFRHVITASKNLMQKCKTNPKDYKYAIFHQPNGKFPERAAAKLGFTKEQILPGMLVNRIGNTYSGASLIGLAAVLDIAAPGDRILLTSYGSGAGSDSFDIQVTKNILSLNRKKTVSSYLSKTIHIDYPKYLKFTGRLK